MIHGWFIVLEMDHRMVANGALESPGSGEDTTASKTTMTNSGMLNKLANWLDELERYGHFEANPGDPVTTASVRRIAAGHEKLREACQRMEPVLVWLESCGQDSTGSSIAAQLRPFIEAALAADREG